MAPVASRAALVKTPRSGAKPLPGSPGASQATVPPAAPPAAAPDDTVELRRTKQGQARLSKPRTATRQRSRIPGRGPGEPFRFAQPADASAPAGGRDEQQDQAAQDAAKAEQDAAEAQAAQADAERRAERGPIRERLAGEGSGAFLALFAYPLILNLIRGGPAQMWGWVKAKFINQPYTGAAGSAPSKTGSVSQPIPPHQAGQGPGQHPGR